MLHRTDVKVRFYELDPYNHVNHAAYVQYFEVGRIELLESVGFGLSELHSRGYHLVVTGLQTRFLRSAGPGDTLNVDSGVLEIRRASSRWIQRLLRGDQLLASQTVEAAATDIQGKPIRFPAELAAALAPFLFDEQSADR